MRPDLRPGGTFPDYALPEHTGTVRGLQRAAGVITYDDAPTYPEPIPETAGGR